MVTRLQFQVTLCLLLAAATVAAQDKPVKEQKSLSDMLGSSFSTASLKKLTDVAAKERDWKQAQHEAARIAQVLKEKEQQQALKRDELPPPGSSTLAVAKRKQELNALEAEIASLEKNRIRNLESQRIAQDTYRAAREDFQREYPQVRLPDQLNTQPANPSRGPLKFGDMPTAREAEKEAQEKRGARFDGSDPAGKPAVDPKPDRSREGIPDLRDAPNSQSSLATSRDSAKQAADDALGRLRAAEKELRRSRRSDESASQFADRQASQRLLVKQLQADVTAKTLRWAALEKEYRSAPGSAEAKPATLDSVTQARILERAREEQALQFEFDAIQSEGQKFKSREESLRLQAEDLERRRKIHDDNPPDPTDEVAVQRYNDEAERGNAELARLQEALRRFEADGSAYLKRVGQWEQKARDFEKKWGSEPSVKFGE